jgi:hypothetical protein
MNPCNRIAIGFRRGPDTTPSNNVGLGDEPLLIAPHLQTDSLAAGLDTPRLMERYL